MSTQVSQAGPQPARADMTRGARTDPTLFIPDHADQGPRRRQCPRPAGLGLRFARGLSLPGLIYYYFFVLSQQREEFRRA